MSSSKVKCTCGWSWNKSDSSKKDMYICHECGRDNSNNMKNGGWLDNYNDSEVSLPEGYVGEGYDTSGRNYSPAWGGQFEEGGELPMAQKGKKVKPITTNDPADPRLHKYLDSLNLYKGYELSKKYNIQDENASLVPKTLPKGKVNYSKANVDPHNSYEDYLIYQKKLSKKFNEIYEKQGMEGIKKDPFFNTKKAKTNAFKTKKDLGKYAKEAEQLVNEYEKLSFREPTETGYWKTPDLYHPTISEIGSYYKGAYNPIFKKPNQEVVYSGNPEDVEKLRQKPYVAGVTNSKPTLQPRVEALNLQPIEQTPINIPIQELDFNTPIKAPKSYNVSSQRTNVNGINDFYNNVQQGVDYEQALKSKQSADAYNKYIQEKYGNEDALKNPKAVERLKQLRQNVEIVPQYQMGGSVYPINYVPQAQDGENVNNEDYNMKRALELGYTADKNGHWPSVDYETGEWLKSKKHHTRGMELMAYELNPELRNKYNLIENEKGKLQYVPKSQKIEEYQMGGSIPGSVGFTYARTNSPAPSNGKYAKKTMASAQNGEKVFNKKVIESTSTSKDRIPVSSKNIIKTLPGTNVHVNNKGEVVVKDEKGVYKPYKSQQSEIKQGKKKSAKEYKKEQEIIKEMQSDNLGLRAPLHYLASPDHMLGDLGNFTGFKPLQQFSNSDEDARRYNFQTLDPSKSQEEKFSNNFNEGLNLLPKAGVNLTLGTLASKTPIGALVEAYNPIPLPYSLGMKIDPTDFWKGVENNNDSAGLIHSQNIFPIRTSISPELREGLQTNGISFANNPKRGENAFKLINDDNKEWIGDLDLTKNYWDDAAKDQWTIENVGIEKPYRGKGFGKEAYIKANELLNSTNRGDLYSSGMFEGPDAKHLWRSLVKSGDAEEIGKNAWKFKSKLEQGGIIKDDRGQWDHPGKITQIDQSKEGSYIDMGPDPKTGKPITQKILAVSDTGDVKLMVPGGKYKLNGTKVTEYPIAQEGKTITVDEGDGKKRKILTDSKEYADLYNEDRIGVKNDDESISFNPFNEVVITPYDKEYPFYQELSDEEKKYFNSDSPIGRGVRRKAYTKNSLSEDVTDIAAPILYGTAAAMLAPYALAPLAGGLEFAGAAAAPYVEGALATSLPGMSSIPGATIGNAINAGFAGHGLYNIAPDAAEMYKNPSWSNAGNVAMDVADIAPIAAGPASKMVGEGFGFVKNKANQALAKASEVTAPVITKGKTLIDDMGAVMSREVKTIDPKINAINDAQSALYQTPEYSNYASESLNLRQQKWALEGKINKMKSKGSTSELNELNDKMDKLQKRINVAEQFTVNGEGLVQSGKNTSLGLRTGSTDIMDLATGEKFPISTSVPSEGIIHRLEGDQVIKTIDNSTLPQASPEYGATVKKNIDFIETQIPGAKVFGSAKNVADAELPHIIGDYDVLMSQTQYEKFAKANPSVGNNGFAELHNIPGAAKGVDPIDINIIQEKGGKAIGTRAEELFKQMAPDEYYAAAKKAIKDKSEIKIPYSSQELVDMTNPTTKSVVDAYESIKDKHLNKIDALINFGKPSVIAEGQQQFVNSLVGSKGSIGHQFPLEQLSNAEANAEILDKIGFIGNKKLVAADPERMQLAINDYYMNNSILTRQVEQGKINKIEAAIKEYYPGAGGGAVNGIGQNHVMLGHPFHGDGNIISMKQLGMNLDTKDPMSYINSIEHQVSGEKLFSQEERDILSDILNNIKFNDTQRQFANQSENTSQLIEKLPYSEEGKKALYEFGKRTNRTIVKKSSQYGNSTYASTLRDFDDAIDAMQYQVANSRNAMKSYRQRSDAAQSTANSAPTISPEIELLPKQFKAIKGYVEGGIERAKERLDALSKQKRKISEDIDALSDKAFNKKHKEELNRLNEFRDKIDKEADDMAQMRRDLFDRKIHLNKLEDKMKTVGILGGGGATLVGLGTFAYKQDQQQRKEFDERLKKMTKEERKQFDKDLEERIRKADSLDRIDKPSSAKFMDWFMGRKQNGGSITKAKDGNQLVKLNQLTNFTNYNTKQPGGWMDKYQ